MSESALPESALVPEWVHSMGVATWVSNPNGLVIYMNQRAETLLGKEPGGAVGHPCHEMIAGRAPDGGPRCQHNCEITKMIRNGEEVEPYTVRINGDEGDEGDEHWLQLLVIPYTSREGSDHIAHCAFRVDRSHLIQSYLDRVAARTPVNVDRNFHIKESRLSKRECEVLELLAEDQNLYEIAEQLNVSYYTVRNHVQHILGKMGVHSTLEAVALFLLSQSQDSEL
jgi:DNA-binding CsgD family transcriptional regulator